MNSLYKALGEEEVMNARFSLLDEGEYDAIVKMSSRKISASNNTMAELVLTVYDGNNTCEVKDYLVFTQKMLWKIKHFCDSAGLQKEYLAEVFTPELAERKHVKVRLRKQTGNEIPFDKLNGKPLGSRYPDKNVVDDYIPITSLNNSIKLTPPDDFINDAIPF